jgi:hypothetical protein
VDAEGMSPALLRVGPEVVRAQIAAVLTAWGMEPDAVATTAQVMVAPIWPAWTATACRC